MAKSKEYELAIKIAGEVEKSFYNSTKLTQKELAQIAKNASTASSGLSSSFQTGFNKTAGGFNALSKVASKSFKVIEKSATVAAAAVAVMTAASVKSGIEFESAFAGVKKTTDATNAEYKELRQGILDMTGEMPATASEIAGVAEAAGQLGIEKNNLLDFTEVMIDLGESTNLTATDAAVSLAKFANITQMSVDDYDNLGSSIVALGNNFATTEADIVEMSTRLAASGELAGLGESQIVALATAMSSVGIEAEAGGSAMSKLIKQIQVAVETGNGDLNDFSKVAGMTADQFKDSFQKDAVESLSAFIDGLNDVKRNGKSATVILEDMGLTEVRLSNTILSLANAGGLMTKAVDLSSDAWDKNTALAEEAGKRYETTESKIGILKNGLTGMGIKIYDELEDPLRYGISEATETVGNLTDKVIPKVFKAIKKALPTVIREAKEFGTAFLDFADPVIQFGGWLIKNPNVIVSTLVGIGSALAAYKIASGIMALGKAFKSLSLILTNPFALAISAVGLAIGGVAGIATYIKRCNDEMKKQNLAEHFGSISLSIEELNKVAKHIVQTDGLGKLQESLSAFDNMESIADSISGAMDTVNKLNWKVSIGMELTAEDKEAYTAAITSFISDTQSLLLQKQYAMSLNLAVMTDDDAKGNAIKELFDQFYTNNYNTLSAEGEKLGKVVADAMSDGMLEIDEIKAITELQAKMASITEKLAGSKFTSKLEVLELKYGGGNLDAESFKNLQAEVNTELEAAVATYDEALQLDIANAKVMLDDKAIDVTQYNDMVTEFKENYLEKVGDIELQASNFQLDTIMKQYGEELDSALPGFQEQLKRNVQETMTRLGEETDPLVVQDFYNLEEILKNAGDLDGDTQDAIEELLNLMQPTVEQMEETKKRYEEYGVGITKAFQDGMNDYAAVSALTGNKDGLYRLIGMEASSEEYQDTVERLKKEAWFIPEYIKDAIEENKMVVDEGIDSLKEHVNTSLYQKFMNDRLTFKIPIDINYSMNSNASNFKIPMKIPGYASGGIINKPTLATFAEEVPEAAIPLDGSSSSIGLWEKVGRILGVYQGNDGSSSFFEPTTNKDDSFSSLLDNVQGTSSKSTEIIYSPNINFYGEAPSKEDIVEASRISQDEFDEYMQTWQAQNARLAF